MPPSAGQKRSAAQNGESSSAATHASKKTRFVEPADDPVNFAEQVDAALEGPSRKGKIKTEGYESDSSDDGEGVVESRKKSAVDKDDEEDDMFAMAETEEKPEELAAKKKDKYMRLGDIVGQEFNNDSDSDDEEEEEDEDEAVKRKKDRDAMGFELSSFNMREEMEEGKFTEDGSYVRTYDPHAVHDKWMDGFTDTEIKLARKRHREQEKKQRERGEKEEKEIAENGGKSGIEIRLLSLLKRGETVLEALQRLGAQAKRKHASEKRTKRKPNNPSNMSVDPGSKPPPTDVEVITQLVSNLMSLGDVDFYSKTYEEIVRHVRSIGDVAEDWEPPSADVKYEYKWDTPGAESDGQVFGPFGEEDMKSWFKATYFGTYGEKVKVRRTAGEWGSWDDVVEP
ncbi:hypothetical protein FA15DRAFT_663332 [Coprinopsis marcescibilis]|uniref:GYF domain-containing protein n=1 Tax=Coprinopsis marcescibilis TaxID=230819 RepID=A0A5C3LBM4_COPMA|nr:hypothetical protein FA15DRAFT_663332 [Coprinopsis marcescibilis]